MTDKRNMDDRDALGAAELTHVERQAEAQRAALVQRQREVDAALLVGYDETARRLKRELGEFLDDLKRKRLIGERIRPSQLYKLRRFETLLNDVEQLTLTWSASAAESITTGQESALEGVNERTLLLVEAGLYPSPQAGSRWFAETFGRLDEGALRQYIGISSDGQPLGDLLAKIAPRVKEEAREELLSGLTRGQNPREIARSFEKIVDVPLHRALTISRTEILRAHRSAALDSYKLNSNVVTGWRWVASLSTRTCPACWAMHGTEHSLDDAFDAHPRCRCTPAPITKSWGDLGFPGVRDVPRQGVQTGSEVFASLPERLQREVLGPTKFEMYREGVPFKNFAVHSKSKRWGGMYREATAAEARIGKGASA